MASKWEIGGSMHRPRFSVRVDSEHELVVMSLEGVVTDLRLTPDYAERIGRQLIEVAASLRIDENPLDGTLIDA
jgi:predicted transcriptional regulator